MLNITLIVNVKTNSQILKEKNSKSTSDVGTLSHDDAHKKGASETSSDAPGVGLEIMSVFNCRTKLKKMGNFMF